MKQTLTLNSPTNTDAIEGAEHVHFHHKLPDQHVVAKGGKCAVEVVCHCCHASILVFFVMPPGSQVPADVEKVHRVRDDFVNTHWNCKSRDGMQHDFKRYCPARRASRPRVYDFARALS